MRNLKPYSGNPKLVLGFDIGTTFSSVSYCVLESKQVPEILGVRLFPGQVPGVNGDTNVPSLLYYDESGHVRAAGAEGLTESVINTALMEGWTKVERWKLHLCPEHLASNYEDDLPPLPHGKTAVDVLADFIKYLFCCTKTYIESGHPAFSWPSIKDSIEYIFTYPNDWEDIQQQLFRHAIELAGLLPSTPESYSRVHLLTEGEACLHFCVANLINWDLTNQATPQGVVIIDSNRETVVLSMFLMTSNPIYCEEIAPAEYLLQGPFYVTRRAKVLIERKLQGWEHSSPEEIAEYTREFDHSTRLVIKSDREPAYVRVGDRRTFAPKYNISLGKLKLTGEEATGLFKESIDAIIGAFEQQRKIANTNITLAFIVGEFACHDWFWSHFQSYFKSQNISVFRPDDHADTAVANGAVLPYVDHENHKVTPRVDREDKSRQPRKKRQPDDSEHKAQFNDSQDAERSDAYFEVDDTANMRRNTIPRGDNDLSTAVPEVEELRQRLDALSAELDYTRKELAINQGTIAPLIAEVGRLKQSDAESITHIGIGAFRRWMSEGSIDADKPVLDGDLSLSSDVAHHVFVFVHKALVGACSQNWNTAYQDAKKSVDIHPSAMGHIAQAFILAGKGEREEALKIYDLAFHYCHPSESSLLLLVKAIISCVAQKYNDAISRINDLMDISRDEEIVYSCLQVLGKIHLIQGDFGHAIGSLEQARRLASSCTGCHLETISIIFGWTFDRLQVMVQLQRCEVLLAAGRAEDVGDVAEELLQVYTTFANDMSKATATWAAHLKNECLGKLEALGDEALESGKHGEAIARYSSALSLSPSNQIDFLVKRSQARAAEGLWEDALTDADEVIELDPLSHRGYERKSMALYRGENYAEAIDALCHMFSIIEKSPDEVRRSGKNYIRPLEAIHAVDTAVQEIFRLCPLVLIDLDTGKLRDEHDRLQAFKSDTAFKKLVAEAAFMKLDYPRVRRGVAEYFKWVMFSHTWQGKEPSFQDVNMVDSVWNLSSSPLNEKLRQFCATSREDGHRWAWSDTCCIDKSTSAILSESIISMYRWYEEAAETLVHLADVLSPAEPGDLTKSRWMTRAWTLQELLASKVVRFYTRDWKLYLNDTHRNHKESPWIKKELAQAFGVMPETIASFHPDYLGVREKLRLASNRNATREEDIAYSLIGIFSSSIHPQYGLRNAALGELLENVIARTGDVTVIAWTGKSLSFNSALPDSLSVYSRTPYSPPPMEADEFNRNMSQRRSTSGTQEDTLAFYNQVVQLPRATFSSRCLQLPCITFSVTKLGVQDLGGADGTLYHALVSVLGRVEFRTADAVPLAKPRKLILIHPWFHDLFPHLDEFGSDDERVTESEGEPDAELNEGASSDTDDSDDSAEVTPLHAKPSDRVDRHEEALRLLAQLGRPFNALLLMRQHGQYKRVATEYEIIVPGVPGQTDSKDLRAKVLEIV